MITRHALCAWLLGLLFLPIHDLRAQTPSVSVPRLRVDSMTVQLYYGGSGTIDTTNLANPAVDFVLSNVVAGGGDAREGSKAILVRVHFATTEQFWHNGPRISLTAIAGRDTLLRQSLAAGPFQGVEVANGWVPFIVPGTGCTDLVLTARAIGTGVDPKPLNFTVGFVCHE